MPAVMSRSSPVIFLHPDDNIVVAARNVPAGSDRRGERAVVAAREADRPGAQDGDAAHPAGQPVKKFGQTIGFASADIAPGSWVHTHNVEVGPLSLDYAYASEIPARSRSRSPGERFRDTAGTTGGPRRAITSPSFRRSTARRTRRG